MPKTVTVRSGFMEAEARPVNGLRAGDLLGFGGFGVEGFGPDIFAKRPQASDLKSQPYTLTLNPKQGSP